MSNINRTAFLIVVAVAGSTMGCASQPKAPFDTLKNSNVVAYRLQNFELPPQAAQTPNPAGMIPGIPPEIQQWVQQGAQGLSQLLPPGLLPPGALQAPTAPAPQPDAPRFHGFRILSQSQVMDPELKEQLGELFGTEDSFDNKHAACAYAEMGLSFSPAPGVQNDMLISFSCNQVVSQTFAWPYPYAGMKPETVSELSEIVQQIWPPGT